MCKNNVEMRNDKEMNTRIHAKGTKVTIKGENIIQFAEIK